MKWKNIFLHQCNPISNISLLDTVVPQANRKDTTTNFMYTVRNNSKKHLRTRQTDTARQPIFRNKVFRIIEAKFAADRYSCGRERWYISETRDMACLSCMPRNASTSLSEWMQLGPDVNVQFVRFM